VEILQMLLQADDQDRTTLFECDMHHQLPLHMGARCNMDADSIQVLLDHDHDKKTLLVQDNAGRIPLHVAFLRNNHSSVLERILRAMLVHRIERVGLDLWKRDMRWFLKSLETHERDFNTSDKLEMTRDGVRELMERAFLLELIIWRTSCLIPHSPYTTMQEIVEKEATDESFSANAFKQERRIKSGAEIIVPGVLSFVEDETVVKLMQQFSSN
jgi:hypothetical protein